MGETLVDRNIRLLKERVTKLEEMIGTDLVEKLNNFKPEKVDLMPLEAKINSVNTHITEMEKKYNSLIEQLKSVINAKTNELSTKILEVSKKLEITEAKLQKQLDELFEHPSIKIIEDEPPSE